jgi:LacI family gluconate utilization system Gnt-I transcriptional repressor
MGAWALAACKMIAAHDNLRAAMIWSGYEQAPTHTQRMKKRPTKNAAKSPPAPVTKADVARAAGVSHITVSRVINTPEKVAPDTRKRVEAFIASMDYIPNLLAGGLASNRTGVIAAIVPTIGHSIFAETIRGLSEKLSSKGYQLLLGQTDYSEATETALVETFIGRRVDGIVLTGIQHSARTRRRLQATKIAVVETWDLTRKPIDMLVGFSNYEAGRAMGEYLYGRGHRNFAFAGGPDARGLARFQGYAEALRQHSVKAPVKITVPLGSLLRAGREALAQILNEHPKTDAIFFSNDVIAAGALMECIRLGIRVPEQVAIAGFADLEIATELTPSLTTVQVSGHQIGEKAAQLLLAKLAGEPTDRAVCDLGFAIVPRASA